MPEPSAQAQIERLTDGQRVVVAMVADNKTSKEIALELGISPNTVDQRIKNAQAKLGVHRRSDAARLYRAATLGGMCGELVYPSPGLASAPADRDEDASPGMEDRTGGGSTTLHQAQAAYAADLPTWGDRRSWSSVLLEAGRRNELTPLARVAAILGMTLAALVILAAAVATAEGMSRIF